MKVYVVNTYNEYRFFEQLGYVDEASYILTHSVAVQRLAAKEEVPVKLVIYSRDNIKKIGPLAHASFIWNIRRFLKENISEIQSLIILSSFSNDPYFAAIRSIGRFSFSVEVYETVNFKRTDFAKMGLIESIYWQVFSLGTSDFYRVGAGKVSEPKAEILSRMGSSIKKLDRDFMPFTSAVTNHSPEYDAIFFMQPIWRSGKVSLSDYKEFLSNLLTFSEDNGFTIVLKPHPRMTVCEMDASHQITSAIRDSELPGELLGDGVPLLSLSSQVIWHDLPSTRISLVDLVPFRSEFERESLKAHIKMNSDCPPIFCASWQDLLVYLRK